MLVAAFSVAATLGVLGGFSDAKDEVRANSTWPSVAVNADAGSSGNSAGSGADEAGS
ncbi:hypothetical protein [Streptomyces lomondensis]|uniref:hypothetical protein n=1 Tax=Streptomyces lomondensis TaxID=68229 RepID=UPI001677ECE9|nr:hypothetical protein [Streptomyces lomondensis]MCF0077682.1 hypothetical protein [Streptomyces lomondensis]